MCIKISYKTFFCLLFIFLDSFRIIAQRIDDVEGWLRELRVVQAILRTGEV